MRQLTTVVQWSTEMSKRPIQNNSFDHYLKPYQTWLERLGYAERSVYSYKKQLQKFLEWLSIHQITVEQFNRNHLLAYEHQRPNEKRDGGLSITMIRTYLQVIYSFAEFLLNQEQIVIPVPDLSRLSTKQNIKINYVILTQQEIQQLYEATENNLLGQRDRMMLSLYYGCGLRRKEGINLKVDDIDWKRQYLFIRNGKGGKDRIIPFNDTIAADLKGFILQLSDPYDRVLPICGQSIINRLKKLAYKAQINKEITVHCLRHSIATHLLQQGVPLEYIRLFLGHSSLETTQIYTHLSAEMEMKEGLLEESLYESGV